MRMFATDVDGTLLRSDGSLAASTVRELQILRETEIVVVVLSARPFRMVHILPHLRDIADYAICDNGCSTWHLGTSALVDDRRLTAGDGERVCNQARRLFPDSSLAIETGERTVAERGFVTLAELQLDMVCTDVVDRVVCVTPVSKVMVARKGCTADELSALGEVHLRSSCVATHSGRVYLELGPLGVTKATALAVLCARLGCHSQEVVACGDMPNDVAMLRWAGRGVAMGQAHPEVLAVADVVTLANDDDGVSAFLRSHTSRDLLGRNERGSAPLTTERLVGDG